MWPSFEQSRGCVLYHGHSSALNVELWHVTPLSSQLKSKIRMGRCIKSTRLALTPLKSNLALCITNLLCYRHGRQTVADHQSLRTVPHSYLLYTVFLLMMAWSLREPNYLRVWAQIGPHRHIMIWCHEDDSDGLLNGSQQNGFIYYICSDLR